MVVNAFDGYAAIYITRGNDKLLCMGMPMIVLALAFVGLVCFAGYDRWNRDKRGKEMLRLIRPEVEANLRAITEYWGAMRPRESEDELHSMQKRRYALEFASRDLPPLSHLAYQSQRVLLPRYLSRSQFSRLSEFYERLDAIAQCQRELRSARNKDRASGDIAAQEFNRIAGLTFDRARHLFDEISGEEGDPLRH